MTYRGFFARRTSFGERLSYANVMATLAFFLALGGGAYAATQINGHQIMPHSIPANRLTRSAGVHIVTDNVSHLVLSKGNATKGKHGSAHIVRLATATVGGTDQISLSYGQEVTALSVGAFTITAKCDQAQGGRLDLYATANVDNWYAFLIAKALMAIPRLGIDLGSLVTSSGLRLKGPPTVYSLSAPFR